MTTRISDRPVCLLVARRCRILGYSPRTAESYAGRLAHFEDWCGHDVLCATPSQATAWLEAEAEQGKARRSLILDRHAIAFLFRHLRHDALGEDCIPTPRPPQQTETPIADPEELALVLSEINPPIYRLFCRFVYATGLRLLEALAVRWADLDERDRSILVLAGKGGRQRRTILSASLMQHLREHRCLNPGEGNVFIDRDRPLDPERIRKNLLHARQRCGVTRSITIHHLRRCFATHLHERGVGLGELQRLLGHASITTTLGYIGLRERRRAEIAVAGDLLAALPRPRPVQQAIAFSSLR